MSVLCRYPKNPNTSRYSRSFFEPDHTRHLSATVYIPVQSLPCLPCSIPLLKHCRCTNLSRLKVPFYDNSSYVTLSITTASLAAVTLSYREPISLDYTSKRPESTPNKLPHGTCGLRAPAAGTSHLTLPRSFIAIMLQNLTVTEAPPDWHSEGMYKLPPWGEPVVCIG